MASKAITTKQMAKDAVHVKYVTKAKMWVKTTISNGKQTQEWSIDMPE